MGGLRRIMFSYGGLDYRGKQNRGGTVCGLRVGSVWPNSCAPPPILTHKSTTPPHSAFRTPWRGVLCTNKHLETFVLVDVWWWFFSKKVNFMADLPRKYVCRSDVGLVETHSFGVHFFLFAFSGGIG